MILSDVLELRVNDENGESVGKVIDVRFVVDGAPSQLLATPRMTGFVVSPHSPSSFLGYDRNGVTAPRLVARFLAWRHRGSFFVRWEDIAMVGSSAVTLRRGFRRYDPAS